MSRLPFRPDFADKVPYGAPQLDVPIPLNVNENPYPPSQELVAGIAAAVAEASRTINRYPDREAIALRRDLADYLAEESGVRIPAEQIWAANGSNEVISHLMTAFAGPDRTAVSFAPTYSMYPGYAINCYADYRTMEREEDFTIDVAKARSFLERERPAVVFLASPNNPTGTALDGATLEAILDMSRSTGPEEGTSSLVVVDEAYGEFRRDGVASALELLEKHENLVVVRTMSKAFGAAGLRLGYMAAAPAVVDQVRIVRLPYHLSAVTQAAARAALARRDDLAKQVAQIRADRDTLVEELRALGFSALDSDSNFVMFGMFDNQHEVWEGILERGVLIRDNGIPGWLRVSIGTPEENAAFLAALKEVTNG